MILYVVQVILNRDLQKSIMTLVNILDFVPNNICFWVPTLLGTKLPQFVLS